MKTITTLDDDFIKIAIAEKFSEIKGRQVEASNVILGTQERLVGNQMNEYVMHAVEIRVEE